MKLSLVINLIALLVVIYYRVPIGEEIVKLTTKIKEKFKK